MNTTKLASIGIGKPERPVESATGSIAAAGRGTMSPVVELEQVGHALAEPVAPSLEDAWFSQSRPVPRALSSRPPRASSSPPPPSELLGDDTADDWFTPLEDTF